MASNVKASQHWPFGENATKDDAAGAFRAALERKNSRETTKASRREQIRNDRLIVGGRAHAKKHGLS
jgi:hypothetical protein